MVVTLTLAEPDEAPYAYFDTVGIETFQVKDAKGNVVMEGFLHYRHSKIPAVMIK